MTRRSSRKKNVSLALLSGGIVQIGKIILKLITRKIFVATMPIEYLGLTGLFTNIIVILSLAELGIGSALTFALYKPLAEDDKPKISALMRFYKIAYRIIGIIILTIGVVLTPVIPHLIKETNVGINIYALYIIEVINTFLTYECFAYKASILYADQKVYIVTSIHFIFEIIRNISQCFVLVALQGNVNFAFYTYTVVNVVFTVISNIVVSSIVNKKYPFINKTSLISSISSEEKKTIKKNVYALSISKVSGALNNSCDNIFISSFVGLVATGLYSNYFMIVSVFKSLLTVFSDSLTASIGNLFYTDNKERTEFVFNCIDLLYFWIYGTITLGIYFFSTPVIALFFGNQFSLDDITVMAISANLLVDGLMGAVVKYRDGCGLFWQNRYRPLVSVLINIVSSLVFAGVFKWGIPGILLGTIVSRLLTTVWVDPYVVFQNVFDKKPTKYYIRYWFRFTIILITGIVYKLVFGRILIDSWYMLILQIIVFMVFINIIWSIFYFRTNEYKYLLNIIKQFGKKIIKK